MNKPKFLQRYLNNRRKRNYDKIKKKPEYQIMELTNQVEKQQSLLQDVVSEMNRYRRLECRKENEERDAYREKTNPFKADKWKVTYDCNGKVSTVYLNGHELYGAQRFDVDFDASVDGQTPRFTYEGYGSIEIITESE